MAVPVSTRTRMVRRIAADPASTALLLAGPAAVELWPGLRRVAEVAGRTLTEAEHGSEAASVRAEHPRRTPTAYVSTFEWTGPGLPPTSGTLTLAYAPDADGTLATHAALELDTAGPAGGRLGESGLRALGLEFLDNLRRAAEQRSRAA